MSCFVVAKAHIDALLTAGMAQHHRGESWLSWFSRELTEEEERSGYAVGAPWGPGSVAIAERLRRELAPETADEVGQMLWDENRVSYAHRYGEQEELLPYRYERLGGPLAAPPSAVQVLKAIDCYEYQSCEHPSWHSSQAKYFCDSLRRRMIGRLDGYDEAAWEIRGWGDQMTDDAGDPGREAERRPVHVRIPENWSEMSVKEKEHWSLSFIDEVTAAAAEEESQASEQTDQSRPPPSR